MGHEGSYLKDFIPTADQVHRHVANCKICNLQPELRYDINKMVLEGEYDSKIIKYAAEMGIFVTPSNVSTHKKYIQYVADDTLIQDVIDKVKDHNEMYQKYLTIQEEEITKMYMEVQDAKNDQLLRLWTETIPGLRSLVNKTEANSMLPVKDYATAFETMLRCALMIEGKPTGRLAVENTTNITSASAISLSDIDKLSAIFGVDLNDVSQNDKE